MQRCKVFRRQLRYLDMRSAFLTAAWGWGEGALRRHCGTRGGGGRGWYGDAHTQHWLFIVVLFFLGLGLG